SGRMCDTRNVVWGNPPGVQIPPLPPDRRPCIRGAFGVFRSGQARMVTMGSSTNVEATAVSTLSWLAAGAGRIAVPVYQRQYRWETSACAQLLADVRAAADGD